MPRNLGKNDREDLRSFLNFLRSKHPNLIITVKEPVSPIYEITAYGMEASRAGKILVFENVKGFDMPVATNLFSTRKLISFMIGTTEDKFFDVWSKRVEAPTPIEPKIVKTGPVKQVILSGDEIDLSMLPIPKHFEQDAGRYVTAGVTVANDPDTGVVNLSIVRMQLKDRNTFGVSLHSRGNLWDYHRRAKEKRMPLNVAVFIGAHPAFLLGAATRKTDEYRLISRLMMKPIELVKCETSDILVPANAEIVLEGKILVDVEADEGPFAEFTGYVSGRSTRNVMKITSISQRRNPLFLSILPSNLTGHILLGGIAKQAEILRQMKSEISQLVGINWPIWGTHFAAVISLRNVSRELVMKTATRLMELDYYVKLVIVVDDDINIYDERDYLWAIMTRSQPDEDIEILKNMKGHFLDPSTRKWGITSKVIIDATKPEGWKFERATVPQSLLNKARSRLKDLMEI